MAALLFGGWLPVDLMDVILWYVARPWQTSVMLIILSVQYKVTSLQVYKRAKPFLGSD